VTGYHIIPYCLCLKAKSPQFPLEPDLMCTKKQTSLLARVARRGSCVCEATKPRLQTNRLTVEAASTARGRPMAFFQSDGVSASPQDFSRGPSSAYGTLCLHAFHALVIFPEGSLVLGSQVQMKHQPKIAFRQNHPKKIKCLPHSAQSIVS